MFKLFAFVLLIASVNCQGGWWNNCRTQGLPPGAPDHVVTPDHIVSSVCPPNVPGTRCIATRGSVLTAQAYFTPLFVHHRLDATAHAYHFLLAGGSLNLPMTPPHDNACNDLRNPATGAHVGCPTTPGQRVQWNIELTVPTIIPALNNVRVRFALSENGRMEGCVDVTADIN